MPTCELLLHEGGFVEVEHLSQQQLVHAQLQHDVLLRGRELFVFAGVREQLYQGGGEGRDVEVVQRTQDALAEVREVTLVVEGDAIHQQQIPQLAEGFRRWDELLLILDLTLQSHQLHAHLDQRCTLPTTLQRELPGVWDIKHTESNHDGVA